MEVGPQDDRPAVVVKPVASRGPKRRVDGEMARRRVGNGSRVGPATRAGRAALPPVGWRHAGRRDHLDLPGETCRPRVEDLRASLLALAVNFVGAAVWLR